VFAAILAAAGSGERFKASTDGASRSDLQISSKLSVELRGVAIITRTARTLAAIDSLARIIVTVSSDNSHQLRSLAQIDSRFEFVVGGSTRQESIWRGLEALRADPPEVVLIHDAARCLVSKNLLLEALKIAKVSGAVTAAVPLHDSIHQINSDGALVRAIDRASLRAVQTPQAFHYELIYQAHRRAREQGVSVTDDASLIELVRCIDGEPSNLKITTRQDLDLAGFYLDRIA